MASRPDALTDLIATIGSRPMTRTELLARAAVLGVSATTLGTVLAACGSGSDGGEPAPLDTTLPAEIKVYGWSEYVSPKTFSSFEKKTGVKVDYKTFTNVSELLEKMQGGDTAYDVVWTSASLIGAFRKAGLLQPLQTDLYENFGGITDQLFIKPSYDDESDDKRYSVPYMFGTAGFAARLDKVKAPVDSWEQLWDAKYRKQLNMLDDPSETVAAALFLNGATPSSASQSDVDAALTLLEKQKPLVKSYTSAAITPSIVDGLPLHHCWDGDATLAMNRIGLSKVRYVLPREGFNIWVDTVCVPTDAPSPYAANLFLDHLIDPKVAAENANYNGYQPAVAAADPMIDSLVQRAMRPTSETLARGQFLVLSEEANAMFAKAYKTLTS